MAKNQFTVTIENNINRLLGLNIAELDKHVSKVSNWNNLPYEHFKNSFEEIFKYLGLSIQNNTFDNLPYNLITGLDGNLNNLITFFIQFSNNGDQNSYNNLVSTCEATRTLLYQYGLFYQIDSNSLNFQSKLNLADQLKNEADKALKDIDNIRNQLAEITKVAASGSLAIAFSNRKKTIAKYKYAWAILSAILIYVCFYQGLKIVEKIGDDHLFKSSVEATNDIGNQTTSKKFLQSKTSSDTNGYSGLIIYILLRILVIGPSISGAVFCTIQYNRERKTEEDYAHKEAISSVLPSYSNLIGDLQTKDAIISSASSVIFTVPEDRVDGKKSFKGSLKEIRDVIELLKVKS